MIFGGYRDFVHRLCTLIQQGEVSIGSIETVFFVIYFNIIPDQFISEQA